MLALISFKSYSKFSEKDMEKLDSMNIKYSLLPWDSYKFMTPIFNLRLRNEYLSSNPKELNVEEFISNIEDVLELFPDKEFNCRKVDIKDLYKTEK